MPSDAEQPKLSHFVDMDELADEELAADTVSKAVGKFSSNHSEEVLSDDDTL